MQSEKKIPGLLPSILKPYCKLFCRYFFRAFVFSLITCTARAQNNHAPALVYPLPSAQQLAWHEMEMNAFIHFTTNTFTDKEWGYGDEDPAIFNPAQLDAGQWARTLKEAGFKGMILTTKHHDGFCLWPSKYTSHSVKNSPYKGGKGDVVREASNAAKRYGLKFGVYLSPWDRNRADYGQPSYIEYYRNQLHELFTRYGQVFEMWFDGANGGDGYYGGAREKRETDRRVYYNWPVTLAGVRKLQPGVLLFSDAGPDLRWVGNEEGIGGITNWNTITPDTLYAGKSGIEDLLQSGSTNGTKWIPAEVNTSIRPGWFYHAKEDSHVRTPENLFQLYLTSVGRGSTLLLNIPPNRRGLFHENDVKALKGFRAILNREFAHNLASKKPVRATNVRGGLPQFSPLNLTDGNKETYWATNDAIIQAAFTVNLQKEVKVKYIVLQEYIKLGQRVEAFAVEAWVKGGWQKIAEGTTIGYKRILQVEPLLTAKIRVMITGSKACPLISNFELY